MRGELLFVTRKYPPFRGGMEEFAFRLAAAWPGPIHVHALRRRQAWLIPWAFGAAAVAGRRRRRTAHVHLADGLLPVWAPLFASATTAPLTATIHGLEFLHRQPGYRRIVGAGLRRLDGRLVAVSSYTAERARELYGVRATVITNGVDVERFTTLQPPADPAAARRALGLPAEVRVVVTVGRLVPRKGVAWFISDVLPGLPEDVHYAVIGSGPAADAIRTAAGRQPRAHVLGALGDAEVDTALSLADCFVQPNVHVRDNPEGYGIAPAEAAAAGVPVVVSELEGLADMARDTRVATAPPGDAAAWAGAVTRALAEPEWARAKAAPRSWHDVARDYSEFFREVAARSRRT